MDFLKREARLQGNRENIEFSEEPYRRDSSVDSIGEDISFEEDFESIASVVKTKQPTVNNLLQSTFMDNQKKIPFMHSDKTQDEKNFWAILYERLILKCIENPKKISINEFWIRIRTVINNPDNSDIKKKQEHSKSLEDESKRFIPTLLNKYVFSKASSHNHNSKPVIKDLNIPRGSLKQSFTNSQKQKLKGAYEKNMYGQRLTLKLPSERLRDDGMITERGASSGPNNSRFRNSIASFTQTVKFSSEKEPTHRFNEEDLILAERADIPVKSTPLIKDLNKYLLDNKTLKILMNLKVVEDMEDLKLEIKTYEKEMVNIKHLFGSNGKTAIKKLDHYINFSQISEDLKIAKVLKRFTEKERIMNNKERVDKLITKIQTLGKGFNL